MDSRTSSLPAVFFKFSNQLLHIGSIPVFFFLFLILYKPFSLERILTFEKTGFAFNVSMMTAILFLIILITRITLWGLRNMNLKRRTYFLWCVSEIIVSAAFISLYVSLISGQTLAYIEVLPIALAQLAAIMMYPYVTLALLLESDIMTKYLTADLDVKKVRFYDDKHKLKFVTQPDSILYIRADENYCNIYYTDGNRVKNFIVRATMRSIEDVCAPEGIIRCHRSYMVNARRIKVLRKERDGLNMAELDVENLEEIPVTRRYYEQIAQKL